VMHPVVYPRERRHPAPAAGCPAFGDDTVVERPSDYGPDAGIMPGAHVPLEGAHTVVWWDPNALELGKEEAGGLRQQRILALDDGGTTAEEGERAHTGWRTRRAALIEHGGVPTLRIETATGRKDAAEAIAAVESAEPAVPVEETSGCGSARPAGRRFGTLVHAILAATDLDATAARVAGVALVQAQMAGASADERVAATEAVVAALAHPILRSALAAGKACRREAPIVLREPDGTILEGVIDLVFRVTAEGGPAWVVVDYKTDRELEGRRPEYEAQVRSYVRAVAAATGERARGVLLRV